MVMVNSMAWPVELVDSEFPRITFAEAMDGNETMAMRTANRTTEHDGRKIMVTLSQSHYRTQVDVSQPPGTGGAGRTITMQSNQRYLDRSASLAM
jgi:hypothetical protein